MGKRIVIYHGGCIDGFTSAWVAWKKYGDAAEYVPASYGDAPPDVVGRDVLIVDFSYPRPALLEMEAAAASIRVLDHHKTAQDALRMLDFCVFDMERSGAGLAWDHLHPEERRPWLVDYVEDHDLWRFKLPASKAVNSYVGAVPRGDMAIWDNLANRNVGEVALMGAAVEMKVDSYVADMCRQARLLTVVGHIDIPVVNAPYINTSELVGKLAESAPFAVGWYQRSDGKYAYSLRSRGEFDVSALAKKFGGGGHKNAAGFVADSFPDALFR